MRGPTMARSSPHATSAGCWKEARSTHRTPTAAASRTPTRCAARPRCTAPRERRSVSCAGSSPSRPTPPLTTRWSSSEILRGANRDDEIISGGNFHGAPVALAADFLVLALAQLATISERRSRSPRQSGAQRSAGLPDAPQWLAVRVHDGAGDGRGPRLGDQDARGSRERGHHPDLGQPRGPRQHEHGRGAQGVQGAPPRHAGRRHRAALRRAGDRPARAAAAIGEPPQRAYIAARDSCRC